MVQNTERKPLGTLLLEQGRISESEIERALEHQRLQGGYFGQALVDLGIVDQAELDFSLASQASIPYLTPDPAGIDPDVAGLVPAVWAQRNNAIPVAREEGWLTLLVDSPLKSGLAEELSRRSGLSVKLALCTARVVRETIRQVYRLDPVQQGASQVHSLEAFWSLAVSSHPRRWGLSVRHNQVIGWIDSGGEIQRHALMHNWLVFLDQLLSPPPSQLLPPHGLRQWRASVRPDQSPASVMVKSLSGPGGHDLVFEAVSNHQRDRARLPSANQLAKLREAAQAGRVVIGVHSPNGLAARELVTRLPQLLLEPGHRSVCLLREGTHAISENMLVVSPPEEGEEELIGFLERLKLDAVGLEIQPSSQALWARTLNLAPLVLVVFSGLKDDDALPPGINWLLSKTEESQADWELI